MTISNIDVDVEMPGQIFLVKSVFNVTEIYSMLENIYESMALLRAEYLSRLETSNPHSIEGFFEQNQCELKEIFT